MGGIGSGRYPAGTAGENGSQTVEAQQRLSVNWLWRRGILRRDKPWTLEWNLEDGKISLEGQNRAGAILLYDRFRWRAWLRQEYQRIPIEYTPCPYGGHRPWFLCDCGARVVYLYLVDGRFACRVCCGLAYLTQRVPDEERVLIGAYKVRQRLGSSGDTSLPFPERPKGMHKTTYQRFQQEDRRRLQEAQKR
jgi:hypothetical protein